MELPSGKEKKKEKNPPTWARGRVVVLISKVEGSKRPTEKQEHQIRGV